MVYALVEVVLASAARGKGSGRGISLQWCAQPVSAEKNGKKCVHESFRCASRCIGRWPG